jgi:outer membrane protein assembly factor BamB
MPKGKLRRRRVISAAALAAVLIVMRPAGGGWSGVYADVFKGGMRGPYGALPRPVEATASLRPLGTARGHVVVVGGLRLEYGLGSSDVRAVGLRSGAVYWWYHRHGRSLADLAVDRDVVFLLWRDKERYVLDRVDARAGTVVWHRVLSLPSGEDGRGEPVVIGGNAGTVAYADFHRLIGLRRDDGRRRWTRPAPPGCSTVLDPRLMTAEEDVMTVPELCVEGHTVTTYLTALGTDDGRPRWRFELGRDAANDVVGGRVTAAGRELVVSAPAREASFLVDRAGGRVLGRGPVLGWNDVFSDGVVVTTCATERETAWCGLDHATGRRRWRRAMAPPLEPAYSPVLARDGRVYVIGDHPRRSHATTPAQLGIIDLHRGTWLGQYPLPRARDFDGRPLSDDPPKLADVADGVLVVSYERGPDVLLALPATRP